MSRSYTVKEVFYTIQGEGANAGRPAVFLRFSGCNLWSGQDRHRSRDAARHGVGCPAWCDTDFVGGDRMTAAAVAAAVRGAAPGGDVRLVVVTGGEPLLQLDHHLLRAMRGACPGAQIAVETNGTIPMPGDCRPDWVCVSPKVPPDAMQLRQGDELKVVWPTYDPSDYDRALADGELRFTYRYVQPEAVAGDSPGQSVLSEDNMAAAAAWCMAHPQWMLSIQTHKVAGLD